MQLIKERKEFRRHLAVWAKIDLSFPCQANICGLALRAALENWNLWIENGNKQIQIDFRICSFSIFKNDKKEYILCLWIPKIKTFWNVKKQPHQVSIIKRRKKPISQISMTWTFGRKSIGSGMWFPYRSRSSCRSSTKKNSRQVCQGLNIV